MGNSRDKGRNANTKRWIIVSPHLDDAVLSCGALLSSIAHAHHVEVWTLFAGAPTRGPYSHTAQWLHEISGGKTGSRLAAQRQSEDRSACRLLGVKPVHFEWMDAAYRKRSDGRFLYRDSLQGSMHPDDARLVARIADSLRHKLDPDDVVVAPMAIGGHADHIATREAAVSAAKGLLLFYPEVPYVETQHDSFDRRSASMWRLSYHPATSALDLWKNAVELYQSQLAMFRNERGSVTDAIDRYTRTGEISLFASAKPEPDQLSPLKLFSVHAPVSQVRTEPDTALYSDEAAFPAWSGGPLAPVAVFAYNRLDLLQKTIKALEKCDGFSDTKVHVFCDGPSKQHQSDATAVAELQSWAARWCSDNAADLHVEKSNVGLRESIVSGVTSLLEKYETVIVLEDDIVTSPSFLIFMNQALQEYRGRDDIMQVSGHFIPHSVKLPPIGLLRTPGSWGWATWRRAWKHYNNDASYLLNAIRKLDVKAFDMNGSYGYLEALQKNAEGSLDTWAVRLYASMFVRGGLAVYPAMSFTRNIGFGEQGTNCKAGPMDKTYLTQRIRRRPISPDWKSIGTDESKAFAAALEAFYRWQNYRWTKPKFSERVRSSLHRITARNIPA